MTPIHLLVGSTHFWARPNFCCLSLCQCGSLALPSSFITSPYRFRITSWHRSWSLSLCRSFSQIWSKSGYLLVSTSWSRSNSFSGITFVSQTQSGNRP